MVLQIVVVVRVDGGIELELRAQRQIFFFLAQLLRASYDQETRRVQRYGIAGHPGYAGLQGSPLEARRLDGVLAAVYESERGRCQH